MASTWVDEEVPFQAERSIAEKIMETVNMLGLPLKLDQLTKGEGNCFLVAIIQQCKRPEIFSELRPLIKRLVNNRIGHATLRSSIKDFITKSKLPSVARLKAQYEEFDSNARGENWEQYWQRMTQDKEWVDFWFVQATAWFLQLDLYVVDCASKDNQPFIPVSGNIMDANIPCSGPTITLKHQKGLNQHGFF